MEKFVIIIDSLQQFEKLRNILSKYCCMKERGYENRDYGYISIDFSTGIENLLRSRGTFGIFFPDSATYDLFDPRDASKFRNSGRKIIDLDFNLHNFPCSSSYMENRNILKDRFEREDRMSGRPPRHPARRERDYHERMRGMNYPEPEYFFGSGRNPFMPPPKHIRFEMGIDFGENESVGKTVTLTKDKDGKPTVVAECDKKKAKPASRTLDNYQIAISDSKKREPRVISLKDDTQKMKVSTKCKHQNTYESGVTNLYTPSSTLIIP